MLELALSMVVRASDDFFGPALSPPERTRFYEQDVRVNQYERQVRKLVISHLSGAGAADVPYGLLLMSLVKDVERLGDYAKNLVEVPELRRENFPEDANLEELLEIKRSVVALAKEVGPVYANSDYARARELTVEGRSIAKRCDKLVVRVAAGDYSANIAIALTLGARFFKRVEMHLLNVLSSVLMPLHKLDYFDEDVASTKR
ncbi:MAG: PhoU domain-containing protein [Polyangiaceae bacterium]